MPVQEAPVVGQAPAVTSPPLAPIPPYRQRQFILGVGERLRDGAAKGISEQQTFAAIAQERTAIAAAIESEPFHDAFARAYEQAHNARTPQAPVSHAQARHATDDIIKNRANDARQLAQLITQADFIEQARNAPPKPAQYELPPEKIEEMVARFTAENSSFGIDARIHNQQSMEGHRVGHLALAEVYAHNGPLHGVLAAALKNQLPAMDEAAVQALANDWLEARRVPALATAEQLTDRGRVYQQVMQRSDVAAATPAPTVNPAVPLAATTTALLSTTALTPREMERNKTREQRAQDVVYTLNHAISCGLTDIFIQPAAYSWLRTALQNDTAPRWLSNLRKYMHGHDEHGGHTHGPGCGHAGHDVSPTPAETGKPKAGYWKQFRHNSAEWLVGEAVGDVGGVIGTVIIQRMFPGLMQGIRRIVEPFTGWAFRWGAERGANNWAHRQGFAKDSAETQAKKHELYEHEMSHLPQAIMWNVIAVPLNIWVQYARSPKKGRVELFDITASKTFGSLVSNGMLLGGRAAMPDAFGKWDDWSSSKIVMPATKLLGRLGGVDDKTVERSLERSKDHHSSVPDRSHEGRVQDAAMRASEIAMLQAR